MTFVSVVYSHYLIYVIVISNIWQSMTSLSPTGSHGHPSVKTLLSMAPNVNGMSTIGGYLHGYIEGRYILLIFVYEIKKGLSN